MGSSDLVAEEVTTANHNTQKEVDFLPTSGLLLDVVVSSDPKGLGLPTEGGGWSDAAEFGDRSLGPLIEDNADDACWVEVVVHPA